MYKKRELKISMYCFAPCIVIIVIAVLTNCSKDFSASNNLLEFNESGHTTDGKFFIHPIRVILTMDGYQVYRYNKGFSEILCVRTHKEIKFPLTFEHDGIVYKAERWE